MADTASSYRSAAISRKSARKREVGARESKEREGKGKREREKVIERKQRPSRQALATPLLDPTPRSLRIALDTCTNVSCHRRYPLGSTGLYCTIQYPSAVHRSARHTSSVVEDDQRSRQPNNQTTRQPNSQTPTSSDLGGQPREPTKLRSEKSVSAPRHPAPGSASTAALI